MTLEELFAYPFFTLLPMRQKLLALGLLALINEGECPADPIFLKNVVLSVEADTIPTEEIEDDLTAIQRVLPIEVFTKNGDSWYRWGT